MNTRNNTVPADLQLVRADKIQAVALSSDAQEWKNQLDHVMGLHPDLSSQGFYVSKISDEEDEGDLRSDFRSSRVFMRGADFRNQVSTCLSWMYSPVARKTVHTMSWRGSYGLKHAVERWVREALVEKKQPAINPTRNISNGAFIVAAILDGWEPVRIARSRNCGFRRGAR